MRADFHRHIDVDEGDCPTRRTPASSELDRAILIAGATPRKPKSTSMPTGALAAPLTSMPTRPPLPLEEALAEQVASLANTQGTLRRPTSTEKATTDPCMSIKRVAAVKAKRTESHNLPKALPPTAARPKPFPVRS